MNIRQEAYKNNRIAGLNQTKSALAAGYAESTATHMSKKMEKFVESDIQEALEKAGLTTDFISSKLFEKASSSNEMIQLRALELISKLRKFLTDITIDQSSHYSKVQYSFGDKEVKPEG